MIYLDTKMCGYDDDKIGFPSVQAPVVEQFLLLKPGNGMRWVELADIKPFQV